MKKEFEIVITETRSATVTVKAADIDEALDIAEDLYYDNAFAEELNSADALETTFEDVVDYN